MVKNHQDVTYIFAVAMRDGRTDATFAVRDVEGDRRVEVLGEGRTVTSKDGIFKDTFRAWDVHLYRIKGESGD
jgi:hypothetical protein